MATLRLAEGFLYRTHFTAWKLFNTDTFSRKVGICFYIYSQFSCEGFDFSKMQLVFFSGIRNCRMEKSNREKGLRTWHAPCLGTGRRALSERHTNQSFTAVVKSYSARAWICHCAYCSLALLEKADKSKQGENLLVSLF